MNTSKRKLKRKTLIWIWVLVTSMVLTLLPVQQRTVQASSSLSDQGDADYSGTDTMSIALEQAYTPVIDVQPADVSRREGATATFTVVASLPIAAPMGSSLTYQWQRSVDGGTTWENIQGAISSSYKTDAIVQADAGVMYRSVVGNSYDGSETISDAAVLSIAGAPVLTAEGDGVNNLVKLQWTSSLAGQEYYRVYHKDSGGNGLDDYQSIPLKTNIRVLNVYPNTAGSDGLQNWMQRIMGSAPDDYDMQVDKVLLADFNGNDTSTNYTHYLAKDSDGVYEYDVLYFGGWDANDDKDLSMEAHLEVKEFIQNGGGVLLGHDTAIYDHFYFTDLAREFLVMNVGNDSVHIPIVGSDQVLIQRRGFLMNYPFVLGDIGDILNIPESHSLLQFARGDVWIKFIGNYWGPDTELNTLDGKNGSNNFYLTTWNNTALIQTGHSNGAATVDEQKILANTLFYLAQLSTANQFDDRMSQDVASPNAVSGDIVIAAGSLPDKKQISWTAAEDNGSSYDYYMKAFSYTDGSNRESAPASATVTTGIKGYAVVVDEDPGTTPSNTITTANASFEADGLLAGRTYYAHIKTIDNAGNESSVSHIAFTIDADGLTVTSVDPMGKVNDGKTRVSVAEEVGQGTTLVYLNVGSGSVTVPAVGEELAGYTELPTNGLIEAEDGDKLAVAETDANGKVVRFGQTVAKVAPSAAELAVYSVDPAGVEHNGKTQIVASAGAGNSLVNINFGQGEAVEPTQGQILTGYTVLPTDGIIPAVHGDLIAVAELDAASRVVRFNTVKAVVVDAVNPAKEISSFTFDGLTPAVTGTVDENAKTVALTVPYGTNVSALVPTITHIGASVSPTTGAAQNFTSPVTYTVTAADGSTQKYVVSVVVAAPSDNNEQPHLPSAPAPLATEGVEVLINGKTEKAGIATSTKENGRTIKTITLDPKKIADRLQAVDGRSVITIPIIEPSDIKIGVLNGQMVKDLEFMEAIIEIRTEKATYTLPALQVNIDAISEQIGREVKLEDIEIKIEIAEPTEEQVKLVENAIHEGEYTLVVPPLNFSVRGSYGDMTVDVSQFNAYVHRRIAIPEGVDPKKITTGVVVDQDGKVRHVPTKIELIDGKYYATINSLTNSTYALISNPVAFEDVAGHWAEKAVNEMGSRLVVSGISDEVYNPNQAITRAEFTTMMVRALGLPEGRGATPFSDVRSSDWYSGAVLTALDYELISGYEDSTFRPQQQITREQAMVVIASAMEVTGIRDQLSAQNADGVLQAYDDATEVSLWARDNVAAVLQAGIIVGRSNSQLAPQDFMTRAEVAVIIQRLLEQSKLI